MDGGDLPSSVVAQTFVIEEQLKSIMMIVPHGRPAVVR